MGTSCAELTRKEQRAIPLWTLLPFRWCTDEEREEDGNERHDLGTGGDRVRGQPARHDRASPPDLHDAPAACSDEPNPTLEHWHSQRAEKTRDHANAAHPGDEGVRETMGFQPGEHGPIEAGGPAKAEVRLHIPLLPSQTHLSTVM